MAHHANDNELPRVQSVGGSQRYHKVPRGLTPLVNSQRHHATLHKGLQGIYGFYHQVAASGSTLESGEG